MSFEQDVQNINNKEEFNSDRVNIPILKYFWQASPLSISSKNTLQSCLRNLNAFSYLTDYELHLFSRFLHQRSFAIGEHVFNEGDGGFGMYIILKGTVDIFARGASNVDEPQHVASLIKNEFFGELSLLEERNVRNATAIAKENTVLLAFFRPDLDELIEQYPVVAAKILRGISLIVAKRFNSVTSELRMLRSKVVEQEDKDADE